MRLTQDLLNCFWDERAWGRESDGRLDRSVRTCRQRVGEGLTEVEAGERAWEWEWLRVRSGWGN